MLYFSFFASDRNTLKSHGGSQLSQLTKFPIELKKQQELTMNQLYMVSTFPFQVGWELALRDLALHIHWSHMGHHLATAKLFWHFPRTYLVHLASKMWKCIYLWCETPPCILEHLHNKRIIVLKKYINFILIYYYLWKAKVKQVWCTQSPY